jgi:hypothetical protein
MLFIHRVIHTLWSKPQVEPCLFPPKAVCLWTGVKSRGVCRKKQLVIHNSDQPSASLTRLSPDLYRYTLASPVFLARSRFSILGVFNDKAHLPTKHTPSRQKAWLPCSHGYTRRSCSSLCSPRQGSRKAFCIKVHNRYPCLQKVHDLQRAPISRVQQRVG